jgi:hypothetical protein
MKDVERERERIVSKWTLAFASLVQRRQMKDIGRESLIYLRPKHRSADVEAAPDAVLCQAVAVLRELMKQLARGGRTAQVHDAEVL